MSKQVMLVTGASGFVGKALCNYAAGYDFQVSAVTRTPNEFGNNIQNIVCDDFSAAGSLLEGMRGVDVVVHLAARVHVMQESSDDALAAYRAVNVDLTLNLAKQAAAAGVKRFIYMSSIKVNGEKTPVGRAFSADDIPAPEDPYGVSKMEAEQALFELSKSTGMEIVVIRPPLIYGPEVGANFMAMMRWLARRVPLPLGAIDNRRSMVALDNLLNLILACTSHPKASGQVFLVSDDQDVSVTQLLMRLAHAMKVPAILLPVPSVIIKFAAVMLNKASVAQRLCDNLQVDIAKTKEMLNWTPPLSLDEGLQVTADWYLSK
ncbi:SDR family oxidoreductase [Polynucleobacter sp. 86C-FISCH]|uniref:UDP-glucose 4-epimerase family protein n=1 Tax=Polynucleobacter sp. 86C-FISCH TaxID=2689101 RepID=UPI001C0C705D|nr:SDR family oxidoreductase [Polynucleobacter sp. 86C-FISCH]MBU3595991.1 SDR family oxidoreductase [Polynucleobacter sp. 86C-FISCH]